MTSPVLSPAVSSGSSSAPAFTQPKFAGPLADIMAACAELARMDRVETHAIAALLQRIMLGYYADIRKQAQWSLYAAIIAMLLGTGLFVAGLVDATRTGETGQVRYWMIAGSIVVLVAAICFFSYARASRRLAGFYVGLERTNRFILADALCQQLDESRRNVARQSLVDVVAQASMLTMDGAGQRGGELPLEGQSPPAPARSDDTKS
jgi:hypothetical protein